MNLFEGEKILPKIRQQHRYSSYPVLLEFACIMAFAATLIGVKPVMQPQRKNFHIIFK